jgi:DNA (cytosine-5)-methyltransferase 1
MENNIIYGTSLFANVGIDELYLEEVGVQIKVSNELLPERQKIYKEVYPNVNMIGGDFTDKDIFESVVKAHKQNKCSFLIATPPCQGMSVAGKMDENDPRNELIISVVEFIKRTKPDNILIENVPGILKFSITVGGEKVLIRDYIENELGNKYQISVKVCDAADYNTAQHRRRAIFLISKIAKWDFPVPKKRITVEKKIGHLMSLEAGDSAYNITHKESDYWHRAKIHSQNHIEWMKHTPSGKSAFGNEKKYVPHKKNNEIIKGYSTTYKRISWDKPAPTITMGNGSISSQNNVHPGRKKNDGTWSDARVLTVLEIMLLSGIDPKKWPISKETPENLIRKIIGECFPPLFCKAMVEKMPKREK